jgi:glycerophosphoryl diester phosphodiesterase
MLIGHRGYSSCYADNSEESFKNAIRVGFDMIELDINLCKTGELIVYHDVLLDGKPISSYTKTDLQKIKIITLSDYFRICNNKIKTYIDVKGDSNVMKTLILFLKDNIIDLNYIYVASFDIYQLNILKESNLPVKLGLITSNKLTHREMDLYKYIDFFAFNWEEYNNEIYAYLHEDNKLVFLYTCSDLKEFNYIRNSYHFDGLISNIFINHLNI